MYQIKSSHKSSLKENIDPLQYCIAKYIPKRNIKLSQKYNEADLITYILSVTKDIHYSERCVDLISIPRSVDLVGIN